MKQVKRTLAFTLALALLICGMAYPQTTAYAGDTTPELFSLKISYYMEDTQKPIAPSYEALLPASEEYSVDTPEIEGYSLMDSSQGTISGKLDKDTEIAVFYTYTAKEAAYTIHYIGRSITGLEETVLKTVTGTAPIDSVVSVPDESFEGYIREPADLSLTVTADGKAVKNVYYMVKTDPCIIFNANGYEIPIISEKPGTDISNQMQAVPEPERMGYRFTGWDQELPQVMPEEDFIINATWEPGTSTYTVLYWFENAEDDEYTLNKGLNEQREADTESQVTATDEDIEKGEITDAESPFYGFDYSYADTVQVQADGSSVLNVYYNREIWTVNLYNNPISDELTVVDCENLEWDLWQSFSGKYGSRLPDEFPSLEEQREYYTPLNPWEGRRFNGLICLPKSMEDSDNGEPGWDKINELKSFSYLTFEYESITGTHTAEIFPYFRYNENSYHISYYGQTLDLNGYELETYRVIPAIYSQATLTLVPPVGFQIEGSSVRTAATEEAMMEKDWTNIVSGATKISVQYYTEVRFPRVKNTLNFISQDEVVKQVEDVYYETALDEYLKFEPESSDPYMKFAGWYLNPDDFELMDPLASYKMPETDLTFYARWVPVDCTVTFDTRGGSEVEAQMVPRGSCAALPQEPVRDNYTFAGWYTADGDRWNFDKVITGDTTLYGAWKTVPAAQGYKVRHILRNDNSVIAEYTGQGLAGDTIAVRALNVSDEDYVTDSYVVPDALTKSITLTQESTNEEAFYYDMADLKDYTVSYCLEGTDQKLMEDKTVTGTKLNRVTELPPEIKDYLPVQEYVIADLTAGKENKVVIYYKELVDASLTVSKTVTGKLGEKDRDFTIEITILNQDGTPAEGSYPVSGDRYGQEDQITLDDEGQTEILLKDGQSVTIRELTEGDSFIVQEVSLPAGYQVTYDGVTKEKVTGTLTEQSEVSIVNNREEVPFTALDNGNGTGRILLFVSGGILAAAGGILIYRRRKSR